MKKLILILLAIVMTVTLAACESKCEHAYDNACDAICNVCDETREVGDHGFASATCETPKTCATCGKTEGEALGHDYKAATCEAPKTCETCGKTEGEALGHDYKAATCEAPKTCETCGKTEGEALGHDYKAATCEAPKTCETCGKTEGEALSHTYATEYTVSKEGHYYNCICHPALNTVIPHKDIDGDNDCDDCRYSIYVLYTVNLDRKHAGVEVILKNGNNSFSELTDESGSVTFKLFNDEYEVTVKHYNAAHIWKDEDNTVTLNKENNTYNAVFEITEERVEYNIFLFNSDGTLCINANLFLYSLNGYCETAFITNSRGNAVTYCYNGDYIVSIHSPGGEYYYARFMKDGPTTLNITLEDNTPVMTENNPLVIYDICDLPFSDDYISTLPIDNSYDLKAGESIYLLIPSARGKVIDLGTDKLTVEYGGRLRAPDSDYLIVIEAELNEDVVIKLTATEDCTEEIRVYHP